MELSLIVDSCIFSTQAMLASKGHSGPIRSAGWSACGFAVKQFGIEPFLSSDAGGSNEMNACHAFPLERTAQRMLAADEAEPACATALHLCSTAPLLLSKQIMCKHSQIDSPPGWRKLCAANGPAQTKLQP